MRAVKQSRLVAGVDSSTQATKVVVVDTVSGETVREGRAPHPDATEVDPAHWWSAWEQASDGLLDGVEAVSVAGQQHGMVLLDDDGQVTRQALLWNDTRSASECDDLIDELGGPGAWVDAIGSVPVASFTVTKLRWVRDHEPDVAARAAAVALPHDWLTHRLCQTSGGRQGLEGLSTDRGDASGTGWWSASADDYRPGLLEKAFGRALIVPRVAGAGEVVGETGSGALVAAGTGDNMAAALGLDLGPGDVAVSLGTSGTAFARTKVPSRDPHGFVAGFADATGAYLPLVCTLNAARVMTAGASLLGLDLQELDDLAASSPGSEGLVVVPYLDGERTPSLPHATGAVYGLTRATSTPSHLARATVEGMLCALADAIDALRGQGVPVERVLLIGGAARSTAVQGLAPGLFGCEVVLPEVAEYVALGAARQAAWALSGEGPPSWRPRRLPAPRPLLDETAAQEVRARYAEVTRGLSDLTGRQRPWC